MTKAPRGCGGLAQARRRLSPMALPLHPGDDGPQTVERVAELDEVVDCLPPPAGDVLGPVSGLLFKLACAITVPAALGNRVIGDILQMRGTFEAPAIGGGEFTVEARLPVATSLDYPTRLGSLSGGRGVLSTRFEGYQECTLELGAASPRRGIDPRDQAKYILAARKAL